MAGQVIVGIPPDGAEGRFIGFDKDGFVFVLRWFPRTSMWGAVGFERHGYAPDVIQPVAMEGDALRERIIAHMVLDR